MDLEQRILKLVSSNNSFIHDDCAYLSKSHQLISTDTLVENVHFNLKHFDASKIAHRLFVCNYSHIQSSGGYPEYALLNISFPTKSFKITQQIVKFFKKLLTKHNIKLIGGDTTSSSKIYLSGTFISKPIKKSEIINRKNAKVGDKAGSNLRLCSDCKRFARGRLQFQADGRLFFPQAVVWEAATP